MPLRNRRARIQVHARNRQPGSRVEPLHRSVAFAVTPVNALVIQSTEKLPNGVTVIAVSCDDYEEFRKLPSAVEYQGMRLGKSARNSDRQIAYYRSDVALAYPVKR